MSTIHVTPTTWATESRRIQPGDDVIFADGEYRQQIEILPAWCGRVKFDRKGNMTIENVTTFRSENRWGALILQAPYYGIYAGLSDGLILDGFSIEQARGTGIKSSGRFVDVRNCFVHQCGLAGIEADCLEFSCTDSIVQFNGTNPKHPGLYLKGANHRIVGNIIRNNAAGGISAIPAAGFDIAENLIAQNDVGITLASMGSSPTTISRNTIADNRDSQLRFAGASYDKPQAVVDQNIVSGHYVEAYGGKTLPNVKWGDNLINCVKFKGRERGDYRTDGYSVGWPQNRQWVSQAGWSENDEGIPFRFFPSKPQPQSLMPGGAE